jgi:hypothetical protein
MVEPSFEELMAGRVQPASPNETPKEKEKHISVFWFMVEFLAPKVCGAKGWETAVKDKEKTQVGCSGW